MNKPIKLQKLHNYKCPCRETENVNLKVQTDLSCTGHERWRIWKIDKCIAPFVYMLQSYGINMRHSCCGHSHNGDIILANGETIIIKWLE